MSYARCAIDKAFETLDTLGDSVKITHLRYIDLVADPMEACRYITEEIDLGFSKQYKDRIEVYLQQNAEVRARTERHRYCLEDYGLSAEIVRQEFWDYIERFNIAAEKAAGEKFPGRASEDVEDGGVGGGGGGGGTRMEREVEEEEEMPDVLSKSDIAQEHSVI